MTVLTRSMTKKVNSTKKVSSTKKLNTVIKIISVNPTVKIIPPNKKKQNSPISLRLSSDDLFERKFIQLNDEQISKKYLKIHPITKERLYSRGYYWEKATQPNCLFNNNGYVKSFHKEFQLVDKEYVNEWDEKGRKILAKWNEFDFLFWLSENFDKEVKGYWFLAPKGYYWKWYHAKCGYSFDWVELERIKKKKLIN